LPYTSASFNDPDVLQTILTGLGLVQDNDPKNRSPPTDLNDQQPPLFECQRLDDTSVGFSIGWFLQSKG